MAASKGSIGNDLLKILLAIVLVVVGFKFFLAASKFLFYAVVLVGAYFGYGALKHALSKED